MSLLYGKEPGWRVESYARDINGALSLEVIKPWSPLLEDSGEGSLRLPDLPAPPAIDGFVVGPGRWKRTKDGGMAISFSYQGAENPDGGGLLPGEEFGVKWSVAGSFRQRDIRTHPAFAKAAAGMGKSLKELYGWDEDKQEFPPEKPNAGGASSGGFAGKGKGAQGNLSDMYGVRSYDDLSCVLTKTYLTFGPPAGMFNNVGAVVANPWSALGEIGEGRDWRIMPGAADPHGDYFRVRQPFLLSGPGGWNRHVYFYLG